MKDIVAMFFIYHSCVGIQSSTHTPTHLKRYFYFFYTSLRTTTEINCPESEVLRLLLKKGPEFLDICSQQIGSVRMCLETNWNNCLFIIKSIQRKCTSLDFSTSSMISSIICLSDFLNAELLGTNIVTGVPLQKYYC